MTLYMRFFVVYIIFVNFVAFVLMGVDKSRAIHHKWRISEANLFLSALLGGSIGAIIGMRFFHHKTKHWYFVLGMPLIFIIQMGLCMWFCPM